MRKRDDHKNVSLYEGSGYLNIPGILSYGTVFNFIVGGRGTGKTYGILKYIYENNIKSIYLRRTQAQADIVGKADFTPFKTVARDLHIDYTVEKVATGVTAVSTEKGTLYYTAALSTFSALRSFDMSDIEMIIFDEFIPEPAEKATIKNEYETFLNMYETVNRNRELSGRDPVRLIAAANANRIDNALFIGLGLILVTDNMMKKGLHIWHDKKRSITLIYPRNSPISEKKNNTALYRLSESSDFNRMSLSNDYNIDMSDVIPRPEVEYKPVVNIGELCVRRHKSRPDEYLITTAQAKGSAPVYPATEKGILQVKEKFPRIVYFYLFGDRFYYSSLLAKSLFKTYMKIV